MGQRPWAKALGQRHWPNALGQGRGPRPWAKALAAPRPPSARCCKLAPPTAARGRPWPPMANRGRLWPPHRRHQHPSTQSSPTPCFWGTYGQDLLEFPNDVTAIAPLPARPSGNVNHEMVVLISRGHGHVGGRTSKRWDLRGNARQSATIPDSTWKAIGNKSR